MEVHTVSYRPTVPFEPCVYAIFGDNQNGGANAPVTSKLQCGTKDFERTFVHREAEKEEPLFFYE